MKVQLDHLDPNLTVRDLARMAHALGLRIKFGSSPSPVSSGPTEAAPQTAMEYMAS